jgi:hypothetical protein
MFTGYDASQAVVDFYGLHGATLPTAHRDMIRDAIASRDLLRSVIITMETLYSTRDTLNTTGVQLFKDLAMFVQAHNFYGLGERSLQLLVVAERMLLDSEDAIMEGDPDVSTEYAPSPAS